MVTPFAARTKLPSLTATLAVALANPDVAVIVAEPLATKVTRPADDTVATAGSDVAHVTVAPQIVALLWSLTVADSWDVTPSEVRQGWLAKE